MMNTIINKIDYGPLAQLVGTWIGTQGLDRAPDINANPDEHTYTDELTFTVAGPAENAEEQELVAIKYHHLVRKNENGLIFHDQIGHWIYEPATGSIMHSLTIPRGVCVLAGGDITENSGEMVFNVKAEAGSDTFGIIQSPFMLEKAKTTAFQMQMSVTENTLSYKQVTSLFIYGKEFKHVDQSVLQRVRYDND
jgi:hypothetical protein